MTDAVSSTLNGLLATQAWMDAAAQKTARAALPAADPAAAATSGDDLVDGVVQTTMAGDAFAIQVAVLRAAREREHALLDILA